MPQHFEHHDRAEIEEFLRNHPLGTIVVNLNGELWPTPMPLIYQPFSNGWGKIIAHVALNNEMWKTNYDQDVLIIVQGPNTYITPNWYPTKAETQKAVPTWNYLAVHAWGKMTVHHDAKFKRMAVGMLTKIHEQTNERPWKMGDAPQDFLADQLDHIVGIEISIDRIKAKWKLNQNRSVADRDGVIAGLEDRATGDDSVVRDYMMDMQKVEQS